MSQTWKTRLSSWWSYFKLWTYKYIGGLVMEEKKDGQLSVSLGRVSFVAVLLKIMTYWGDWAATAVGTAGDTVETGEMVEAVVSSMPPGMIEVFYVLATYNFGTKISGALKSKWSGSA